MTTTRLIVITVPPQPTREAIQALREPLCRAHNAGWALQYPPHVTLRTGLIVPDEKLPEVFKAFADLATQTRPFTIRTSSPAYGTMAYEGEEHFFLYFPVVADKPLTELNQRLLSYRTYRKSDKRTFSPHLTLLWGDLSPPQKGQVCNAVDQIIPPYDKSYSWMCESFCFYTQRGYVWEPIETFPFKEY